MSTTLVRFTEDYPNSWPGKRGGASNWNVFEGDSGDSTVNTLPRIGARALLAGWGKWINHIGGRRSNGGGYCDHPSGSALDIMAHNATFNGTGAPPAGSKRKEVFDEINRWFNKDEIAKAYGVCYTLWQTSDHYDHIHMCFYTSCRSNCDKPRNWEHGLARPCPPPLLDKRRRPPRGVVFKGGRDAQGGRKTKDQKGKDYSKPAEPQYVVSTIPTDELKVAAMTSVSLGAASLVEAPDIAGLPTVPTADYNIDGLDVDPTTSPLLEFRSLFTPMSDATKWLS